MRYGGTAAGVHRCIEEGIILYNCRQGASAGLEWPAGHRGGGVALLQVVELVQESDDLHGPEHLDDQTQGLMPKVIDMATATAAVALVGSRMSRHCAHDS